jgi:hypothetical protein
MQAKHKPSGVTTTLAAWASELTLAAMPAEVIAHLRVGHRNLVEQGCRMGGRRADSTPA